MTIVQAGYIIRYARNLLGLDGLVYNPGERVEGFSNPTWVAIMAMTLPFSSSLEGSKVIGLLAHAATVVGCAGLAAELVQPQKQAAKIATPSTACSAHVATTPTKRSRTASR